MRRVGLQIIESHVHSCHTKNEKRPLILIFNYSTKEKDRGATQRQKLQITTQIRVILVQIEQERGHSRHVAGQGKAHDSH